MPVPPCPSLVTLEVREHQVEGVCALSGPTWGLGPGSPGRACLWQAAQEAVTRPSSQGYSVSRITKDWMDGWRQG